MLLKVHFHMGSMAPLIFIGKLTQIGENLATSKITIP